MIDRESTFANQDLLTHLRERCIPVALDQAYQRRQQDAEGEFYRRIAGQGPRNDFRGTTQGFYLATPSGELLLYNNNRDPRKVARLVGEALEKYDAGAATRAPAEPIEDGPLDPRWHPKPPEGGLVLRVHTRVLGGYPPPERRWDDLLQRALGRDNLWLTAEEHRSLAEGGLPRSALLRLARYHLVDNTRGEPPMWRPQEIERLEILRDGDRIHGTVHLETDDGSRRFLAAVLGFVESDGPRITRLDLVVEGRFEGEGPFTPGAPEGPFPLAISVTVARGETPADAVPPQGSRGWLQGYLRSGGR